MKRPKHWARYITKVAKLMGVGGWVFDLDGEPSRHTSMAEVDLDGEKRAAVFRLCHDWETLTPDQQRNSIVHELIHVLHWDLQFFVDHDVVRLLGKEAGILVTSHYDRLTEITTDALARAISKGVPLP